MTVKWTRELMKEQGAVTSVSERVGTDPSASGVLFDAQHAMMQVFCKVVVSVPREWLSDDAPAELDWSSGEPLDYLLFDALPLFAEAMGKCLGESLEVKSKMDSLQTGG
jgi:hypothetical protein